MDATALAVVVKAARKEAAKAVDAAVKAAVIEARKIVPEKGDKGADGKVDYAVVMNQLREIVEINQKEEIKEVMEAFNKAML